MRQAVRRDFCWTTLVHVDEYRKERFRSALELV